MSSIKQITFDLDDTLWPVHTVINNAERAYFNALQELSPALTQRYTVDEIRKHRWQLLKSQPDLSHNISTWRIVALSNILTEIGYKAKEAQQISQAAFDVFLAERQKVELFDHVDSCLAQLSKQYSLGVLTNGNADVYKMPIAEHFDFAYRAEQYNESKPGLALFNAALAYKNIPAANCLHIGDCETNDIAPAIAVGMRSARADIVAQQQVELGKNEQISPSKADFTFTCWSKLLEEVERLG